LIVHPARGRWHGTLVNGLMHYAKTWSTVRGPHRPGILHRLDRNTTGVMLVAKSDEAHWRMARQFETRTIQKTYMAIVHGVPDLLAGLIDLPIGQDAYVKERQAVRKLSSGAKTAQTMYEVLESFPVTAEVAGLRLEKGEHAHDQNHKVPPPGFSLLRLKPRTGRTHQLRVHTSFKGYPIIGDTMYGGRVVEYHTTGPEGHKETRHLTRQALHAAEITFTHPRSLKKTTLEAPLPPDMNAILAQLRAATASDTDAAPPTATNPGETPNPTANGVE
ncbi:MAG: RluA family pseudouridine synthase, partial [Planctomycetota bacterium]